MVKKTVRDTVTGKYVDKTQAKKRPATTVTETATSKAKAKKKVAVKPKGKK